MQLQEPMIILGSIQRAEKQVLTDRQDKTKKSEMWQFVFSDATRPTQFRMTTPLIMFLMPERVLSQLGTTDADELADMQVTLAVSELTPYNAFLKIKGQIVKGHLTGKQLAELQAAASAEANGVKPSEVKPSPEVKPK